MDRTEENEGRISQGYLLGKVEALELALEVMIALLPAKKRDFVLRQVSLHVRDVEKQSGADEAEGASSVEYAFVRANEPWPEIFKNFAGG